MSAEEHKSLVSIDSDSPIWDRFYTVSPLVVIGSKEEDDYDLAPKHLAMPVSWDNYFGFVCTPRHGTYGNIKKHGFFTVTYPRPDQVTLASLASSPRCGDEGSKPVIGILPTIPAQKIDGVFVKDGYLFLECELVKIIDGFGSNSIITGKIVHAMADPDFLIHSDESHQEVLQRHPLLAYLYPGRFTTIDKSVEFPFPKDFKR